MITDRDRELTENGEIAVVVSGRDCDGVEYHNRVSIVPVEEADACEAGEEEWADGPIYFERMRPSEAKTLEYSSRDLVAEAHENGHSHVIYSSM